MTNDLTLEQLPIHELRSRVQKLGIKMKANSKKEDYIKAIETGKSNIEEKVVQRAPILQDQKKEKAVALLPDGFQDYVAVAYPNIEIKIDEVDNSVTFAPKIHGDMSVIPTSCNIDVPERILQQTVQQAARGRVGKAPPTEASNSKQAARIDQQEREKKALIAKAKAEARAEFEREQRNV